MSFALSDGTDVNLYYGTYSSVAGEIGPGYILIEGVDEAASAVTMLSITAGGAGTVTPEPSSLALLGSGMVMAAGWGWGRRRRRAW